ncbi:MAG: tRNA (adenosine(37)-N6)-threonylcarbamoyltransferase complex ATPase subunit type 1 TsaE [Nitrospira sp.]
MGSFPVLAYPLSRSASPTFLLVHEYHGRVPVIHIDLYRLKRPEETESIGLSDYLTDDVAVAIEWADRFPQLLPEDRLDVTLAHRTKTTRRTLVEARGSRSPFPAYSYQESLAIDPSINTETPLHRKEDFDAMTRLILVGILTLLSLAFFLQNQEQEVTLRYFFGLLEASTPIYKPIMAGFVVGLLVAAILLFPPWVRGRIDLRRKTKALQEAEVNLERLRQSLEKMSGRTQPSTQMDSSRDLDDE